MKYRLEWAASVASFATLAVTKAALAEEAAEKAGHAAKRGDPTVDWNHLWNEIMVDITLIGIVFGIAAVWMMWRYRARDEKEVGSAPKLSGAKMWAWALIPAAIFMADDFFLAAKGWSLWNTQRNVPPGAVEVKVNAYQWYFEFDYGNDLTSDELVVPVGKPVVLRMTSGDVIHSFGLTEYRLKEDIMPGRVTYIWFHPKKPLETKVVCVEYCGNSHSEMMATVRAVPEEEYKKFLQSLK
ncbi:MAG TPA: cytochrome c oxidase subunit II [Thermopetrobacter sp.]|nr:cytochrome c oxidase subunit II [Thermopetrobacter sp.]